jgi:superfamily I DNA/RNA helicase
MAGEANFDHEEKARIAAAMKKGEVERDEKGEVMEQGLATAQKKHDRAGDTFHHLCYQLIRRVLGQKTSRLKAELWNNPDQLRAPWEPIDETDSPSGFHRKSSTNALGSYSIWYGNDTVLRGEEMEPSYNRTRECR